MSTGPPASDACGCCAAGNGVARVRSATTACVSTRPSIAEAKSGAAGGGIGDGVRSASLQKVCSSTCPKLTRLLFIDGRGFFVSGDGARGTSFSLAGTGDGRTMALFSSALLFAPASAI